MTLAFSKIHLHRYRTENCLCCFSTTCMAIVAHLVHLPENKWTCPSCTTELEERNMVLYYTLPWSIARVSESHISGSKVIEHPKSCQAAVYDMPSFQTNQTGNLCGVFNTWGKTRIIHSETNFQTENIDQRKIASNKTWKTSRRRFSQHWCLMLVFEIPCTAGVCDQFMMRRRPHDILGIFSGSPSARIKSMAAQSFCLHFHQKTVTNEDKWAWHASHAPFIEVARVARNATYI